MKGHLLLSASAAAILAMGLVAGSGGVLAQQEVQEVPESESVTAPAATVGADGLLGRDITNSEGETVGTVRNVIIDQAGEVRHVVVGVGGFLGIGERHVALDWDEMRIAEDGETIVANVTRAELEAMPEYEVPADVTAGSVYTDPTLQPRTGAPDQPTTAPEQQAEMPEEGVSPGEQPTAFETSPGDIRASELVGATVTNAQGETVGEINEVLLSEDGSTKGLVVDAGGFLGIGERSVVLDWDDVTIRADEDGSVTVATDMDRTGIEGLPEYTAPGAVVQ